MLVTLLTEYPFLALGLGIASLLLIAGLRQGPQFLHKQPRQYRLVQLINAELPQTQCGHCSYPGCLPYARAIADGEAINKCAPGGNRTIRRLSKLLNEPSEPLDPAHGIPAPAPVPTLVASIQEDECIGCTKCIAACPTDAIVGASRLMHTVLPGHCTGCDLCLVPCPVDCIDMVALPVEPATDQLPAQSATDPAEQACIRCDACAEICPVHLLPQQLLFFSQKEDLESMQQYGLSDCTECGDCVRVCPSNIALTEHFRDAGQQLAREAEGTVRSRHWERLFLFRQQRLGYQVNAGQEWKPSVHSQVQELQEPQLTGGLHPAAENSADPGAPGSPEIREQAEAGFSRQQARLEIAAAVARAAGKKSGPEPL